MRKCGFDELFVALFMPVTTILLSMICLSVTTWAWFSTSISTGVNEIKAGVGMSVQVSPEASVNNGVYLLSPGKSYTFTFFTGSAVNGYYALITASDPTTAVNPITNLFMTTEYAENEKSYAVYLSPNSSEEKITMSFPNEKEVAISYIWKPQDSTSSVEIIYNKITYTVVDVSGTIPLPDEQSISPQNTEEAPPVEGEQDEPAEEGTNMGESNPENVTGNAGEQSISNPGTETTTEPTTTTQEPNPTPTEEATIPVQEPDQSTTPSENETTPTPATGEMTEGQSNTETGGEEGGVQAEMKTEGQEVDAYAQG